MGQWGFSSYKSDDVYDFLEEEREDGGHVGPATILNNAWKDADYDQTKWGVVVYILSARKEGFDNHNPIALHLQQCQANGYKIPMSKLKEAKEIAIHLLADMEDWIDEDKRRKELIAELVMIQNEIDGIT